MLVSLARSKLAGRNTRMADEEDVALSALDSFIRAVADNRFPNLRDRDGLWRLLSVMTFRKVVDRIRHEERQKRRVEGESAVDNDESQCGPSPINRIGGDDPTPELAATLAEDFQRLLGLLEPELRSLALRKMEGFTNRELAERLACSVPTIERRLQLIRKKWRCELPS